MDFRKTFDTIPEKFDKWRSRYCDELFADVINYAEIDASKSVLEIGPGTGQATEPFLKTGCNYSAIELGEHFVDFTKKKFGSYINFNIVNDDFEIHDFGNQKFDLVFSAATIQWIPEKICFPKVYNLLNSGGTLAMFMTLTDEKTSNRALYDAIQKVYDEHFHVETKYTCSLNYDNVVNYGFVDYNYRDWKRTRVYTAEEYIEYLASTQVEHITLQEPYKSNFYNGVREAIINAGNKIILNDTIALYLAKKPCLALP
ncbi:class I SAM-dependent methyltransferase [Clostridium sp. Marseille-P2415]|uniref:class I SAM-dependent methyltransferase n=1 Tax=Clostridium sp. Marseille-P2415 TaxID=1805471 RepID=UPI0009885378|nr:class I SAM-dependent methyltransferase [Clostridium sp. Marseille-P2415]